MENPILTAINESIDRRKTVLAQTEKDLKGYCREVNKLEHLAAKIEADIKDLENAKKTL